MNFNILHQFRQQMYQCLSASRDALFNLSDALLCETQAHSLVELSLSPHFTRQWPSIYQALQKGRVDQARFEQTLVQYAPEPMEGQRLVVAVDASNIERPFSDTSPDRGCLYVHNLPHSDKPVTVGWQFSTVVVVPPKSSSHTYILSNRRIPTEKTPAEVAISQLKALRPHFKQRPISLGDRYYPTKDFLVDLSEEYDLLVRLKANRVFYRHLNERPVGTKRGRGAPAKHGPRFQCNDPATHGVADCEWEGTDERGAKLAVSMWHHLHLYHTPSLSLQLIRVRRHSATGRARDPFESWFVWSGAGEIEASEVWATYKRRYSIEHGFRFDKQNLLWTKPRLREPGDFERWTALVSFVHNELVLAEGLEVGELRPWENNRRTLSPQQIRRGLGSAAIMVELGDPTRQCQKRGKGRGRTFGSKSEPARRYPVVKKSHKKAKVA